MSAVARVSSSRNLRLGVSTRFWDLTVRLRRRSFGPRCPSSNRLLRLTEPVNLSRRFELAMCLEVAEHLPAESADILVETLTNLAPVVMFSAAHPGQGGQDHVNERWPAYWYRRFAQHGYGVLDILRGPLSDDPGVLDCYRRNIVFYVESSRSLAILVRAEESDVPDAFVLAHQDGITTDLLHQPWRVLVRTLVRKLRRRVWRRAR